MKNEEMGKIAFLIVIAGRKQKDDLLSALSMSGAHLTNIIYAKGTVNASYLQNVLGMVPEVNKVMISCILSNAKSTAVLKMLADDFNFNKPNTGVAFTIPIDSLSF